MDYKIKQIDVSKDKNLIIDFWSKNFPDWPKEKYEWFYRNNPAGVAYCWFVNTEESDEKIGTVALFPRIIYIDGKPKKSGVAGDLIFKNEYRSFWPAFMLQKKVLSLLKNGLVEFVYGSPNTQADQLMKRAGYKIIGTSVDYKKIVKTYNYLLKKLKNKILSRFLSTFLDLLIICFSKETYKAAFINKNTSFEIRSTFDDRFDLLWEKCMKKYPIIGKRDSKYLNWRFNQCPYIEYKSFILFNKTNDEIYGYIIYKIQDNQLIIADILLEDIDKHCDNLLVLFLKYVRKLNVNSIVFSFLGPDNLKKKLKKYNFLNNKGCRSFSVYANESTKLKDILFDFNNWYFMECDNDI